MTHKYNTTTTTTTAAAAATTSAITPTTAVNAKEMQEVSATTTTTTTTTTKTSRKIKKTPTPPTTTTTKSSHTATPTATALDATRGAPQATNHRRQAQLEMPQKTTTTTTTTIERAAEPSSTTQEYVHVQRIDAAAASDECSRPATMERHQRERQSWVHMRRQDDAVVHVDATATTATTTAAMVAAPVTPSPQTSRSYVSNVSTIAVSNSSGSSGSSSNGGGGDGDGCGDGGCGGAGGESMVSGRTTATSGRNSSSGVATISGSNHTLNDIISDYQSNDYHQHNHHHHLHLHHHQQYHPHHNPNGATAMRQTSTTTLATTTSGATTAATATSPMKINGSFNMANGSTVKLLSKNDDEANQQTKCSVFRSLVLCVCLNVTYANVVRFPRELDRYGLTYLIPYVSLLLLVGLPIALLEVAVGQFLGQSAAHTWRASPIFKGACIVSRFASWFSTIWVSLQGVVALAYIGMLTFNTVPFPECVGSIQKALNRYMVTGNSGQDCLHRTFLMPFWENPLYFGLLSIGLICIWLIAMLCTHNGRTLRRCLFLLGLAGFGLLCALAGWEVSESLRRGYFPQLLPLEPQQLYDSNIWFHALVQVIFSLNIGCGVLPTLTGKFLYKGDAVRTAVVYLCFNLLVCAVAVTLFMAQFDFSVNGAALIDELKPLTAVYDHAIFGGANGRPVASLLPTGLLYGLAMVAALVSITLAIYTSTRLVPRHPNYVIGLVALVMSIISFSAPGFTIARLLDARIIGTMVVTALVFDLIAITWIYGATNIYTDLEFSIGRPILRGWMWLWCVCPSVLTGVLVWWCSDDDQFDLVAEYMPRWAPILFVLSVIFVIACVQIFRQVEYNFFGMICEASKSAKEWGPADPLARHAWKQWRSVCQDTGRRDFTLRRRGTRDYTHSIKKGQYSTTDKYGNGQAALQQHSTTTTTGTATANWKTSSTPGNSSPNYSGSMFGDSAIEEDISVDKFPGITQPHQQQQQQHQQFVPFHSSDGRQQLRYSHRSRGGAAQPQQRGAAGATLQHVHSTPVHGGAGAGASGQQAQLRQREPQHREVVYISRLSDDGQHATRIEITPSNESITYGGGGGGGGSGSGSNCSSNNNINRNPLARNTTTITTTAAAAAAAAAGTPKRNGPMYVKRSASSGVIEHNRSSIISVGGGGGGGGRGSDGICWHGYTVNGDEYSTEL